MEPGVTVVVHVCFKSLDLLVDATATRCNALTVVLYYHVVFMPLPSYGIVWNDKGVPEPVACVEEKVCVGDFLLYFLYYVFCINVLRG